MSEDIIVAETRKIRDQLSKKFDYNIKTIFAKFRERQGKLDTRLVRRTKNDTIKTPSANMPRQKKSA